MTTSTSTMKKGKLERVEVIMKQETATSTAVTAAAATVAATAAAAAAETATQHQQQQQKEPAQHEQKQEEHNETQQRYLILVEFVYRHLNFQMAELESILDTHGITYSFEGSSSSSAAAASNDTNGNGTTDHECTMFPLPFPAPTIPANNNNNNNNNNNKSSNNNRAFVILSFPISEAPRWSGLLQTNVEQHQNHTFHPRIVVSKSQSVSSIADILYKCTLVKSVVELWGSSSINLHDCAEQTFQWLNRKSNNSKDCNKGESSTAIISSTLDTSPSLPLSSSLSSFQQDYIWPNICGTRTDSTTNTNVPWKMTIHTLGTKVTRKEQDQMREIFRATLDCFQGPVKLTKTKKKKGDADADDPTTQNLKTQEFLLIREIVLNREGNPFLKKNTTNATTHKTNTTTTTKDNNKKQKKEKGTKKDKDQKKQNHAIYNTEAIAYYFGRVLGGRVRSNDGSRGLHNYSLKSRPYLGPTSMDAELSFIMTSLGKVSSSSIVYDPFVGTGSILLACAMRGAFCVGSDIDLLVLRGKGGTQTIWKNFDHYQLPRPEIIRTDNANYHRHYRHHPHHHHHNNTATTTTTPDSTTTSTSTTPTTTTFAPPLYDAILCDPPYGIRAGARQTGAKFHNRPVRPILEKDRHDHIAQTKPYNVSDVMSDLLDVAARTLKLQGRLVYIIPSFQSGEKKNQHNQDEEDNENDNDDDHHFNSHRDLPRHDCLELIYSCYQPLSKNTTTTTTTNNNGGKGNSGTGGSSSNYGRRIVAMQKIRPYEVSKRPDYLQSMWVDGTDSADKCANLRAKIMEAARQKPGYQEKAAIRKGKRKANKEAKKEEKKKRKNVEQQQQAQLLLSQQQQQIKTSTIL